MIAETVSVGTELLLGQIVDTNAVYLAQMLSSLGISLFFRSTVGDNPERMRDALKLALSRSDLVITIGGLGPTQDDLTKEILCEVMGVELAPDPVEDAKLRAWLSMRGISAPPSILKQALVPETHGRALPNPTGTAPGIVIEKDGKIGICLPGPPNELIPMTEQSVIPYLSEKTSGERSVIRSRTLRVVGVGESLVEDKIKDLMQDANPSVAPYAKRAEVHLRVTAKAGDETEAEALIAPRVEQIRERLGRAVYGMDEETLESVVVKMLRERELAVATAESCTGGLLAERITSIAGASDVLRAGVVTYSNAAKQKFLGVPADILDRYGAVSSEVASFMAIGARALEGSDYGIGITGIAGPGGGSEEKPVGLVYIALQKPNGEVLIEKNVYMGARTDVMYRATQTAMTLLRASMLGNYPYD